MLTIDLNENKQLVIVQTQNIKVKSEQILIKVYASGVNRADLLQRKGQYPAPIGDSDILGLEVAGVVQEVGDGVSSDWLGKRVMALCAGGGYGELVSVDVGHCIEMPQTYSFAQGAGFCEVFFTAFDALQQYPNFGSDHTLLVHAGASGVGTAAITLAKALGAKVVTTVGTEVKQKTCEQLGADLVVNYRSDDWVTSMREAGLEADVIIDPIAGEYLHRDLNVIARDGRIVVLAMLGGRFCERFDTAKLLQKRAHLIGSTLRNRSSQYKSELVKQLLSQFGEQLAAGQLLPVIDSVFPWQQAEQAHQRLENNENIGKVILVHE
ncbi:NAD(P)H-quinone oxidoreductase [Pseudoalteromonas pernae]|uniref:NAD(P)H-quinone oxidoreductase n=1 Tax=Pseudoalteromonas pernae TaxID=3118054 RepID=UPI003241CB38